MALKWLPLSTYLRTAYPEGEAPDPRTVRRQIDRQEIAGKRSRGSRGHYYVQIDTDTGLEVRTVTVPQCGSPIAAKVLNRIATKQHGTR